jgi:hypothetical protein
VEDLLVVLPKEVAILDATEVVAMAMVATATATTDHPIKSAGEETMMHQGVMVTPPPRVSNPYDYVNHMFKRS